MRRLVVVLICLAAAPAAAARAQEFPLAVSVLGGATVPILDTRDEIGLGWNVGAAGTVLVADQVALRLDYLYSRFAAEQATFDVTLGPLLPAFVEVPVRAKSQMHTVSFDIAWSRRTSGGGRAYLMAGPSLFDRRVQLTGTGPDGQTTACHPLWLQCSGAPIGFDRALGIKKSIDPGFNVGGGVAFQVGLSARLTIEARYFYVRGKQFRAVDGTSSRSAAHFVPISIGLTF